MAATLLACTLLLRLLVPAGWMPSAGADGLIRITLCTGEGRTAAWVDGEGKIHDKAPAQSSAHDQPCAFAGLATALDSAATPAIVPPERLALATPRALPPAVAIGRGLAAPPPPATGPPATL